MPRTADNGNTKQAFLSDVETLRKRARQHIEDGAVTAGYGADRDRVVKILNEALATEIVCVLRYKRHYYMAEGIHSDSVKAEFLEHAKEEQEDVRHRERSRAGMNRSLRNEARRGKYLGDRPAPRDEVQPDGDEARGSSDRDCRRNEPRHGAGAP